VAPELGLRAERERSLLFDAHADANPGLRGKGPRQRTDGGAERLAGGQARAQVQHRPAGVFEALPRRLECPLEPFPRAIGLRREMTQRPFQVERDGR
jgi:hypothetical protein